ncbi:prohead assembly (scaffolding) protein [Salmonella phage S115]|uniref:Prohead core scaffold protein n=3 Tax=Kuttervirus TaxID=2169536 RepID=A0A2Z5HLD0_9CAUD|nr:gp22 prohead core scaffold protein [Escherichia phage Cba120]YP_009880711.1 head scaffolding protein [Salmonella phage S118]YP_009887363.1 head scaffolding protein [Salmonella phage rabagast]AXC40494.1 prohead assembly (scaffolding) protein [Salmonella phage S115]AEM91880.1 gp22 prohead core scaffold protein [Escherichia phage Cba120]AXC41061.1 prohead core scaffold protein [Salmonella phage S118]QIQ61704.1 prohead core scaffold protein [Salmonella phage rabagast]
MKPELQKLFEGVNGLSTDFLDKVSGLLESKVEAARLQAIQETEAAGNVERLTLVEAHQKEVADLKENFTLQLAEKVDSFLNAVVEEWANKNAPAIDAQIKTEAAERFLTGFSNVLKEAGVSFATDPDGQIAALTSRLAEAEQRANMANTELAQLKESETKRQRTDVIDRICEGMVDTKKDTVVNLLEGIEFQTESEFESRVRTFRNLVEGKDDFSDKVGKDNEKGKPDGDKSEKDIKEGKKPKKEGEADDDDDDDDDKDEVGKEVNEAVRRQISALLNG